MDSNKTKSEPADKLPSTTCPRPLNVCDVFEEEYAYLHGEAPPAPATQVAEDRLKTVIKAIHQKQHAALCLSGGGIRSATFGLGVLQALAHNGLLQSFSYISTVSGGGYIGGWLSAWIHRHPDGLDGVARLLPGEHPDRVLQPEAEPINYLRSYSNYLTPRLGFLSADTWTLVAIVFRNLILNWLVFIPLLLSVLALPRVFVSLSQLTPSAPLRVVIFVIGFICGVHAIVYVALNRPSITRRHDDQAKFLKWCLTPLVISAALFALYWAWFSNAQAYDLKHNACFINGTCFSQLERTLTFGLLNHRQPLLGFVAFAVLLHLAAWAVYTIPVWRSLKMAVIEFVGLVVNGLVSGVLLWYATMRWFDQPSADLWTADLGTKKLEIAKLLLFSAFGVPLYLALFFLALMFFVGLASRFTEDEDREWWAKAGAWILIVTLVWAVASFIVLLGPRLLSFAWATYPLGGLVGLVTALLGRSGKSSAKDDTPKGITALIGRYALPVGATAFLVVLIAFLSLGTNYLIEVLARALIWWQPGATWLHKAAYDFSANADPTTAANLASHLIFPSTREILLFIGLSGGFGVVMAKLINTNKFSHHAMYRDRIMRAYLGASNTSRDANRFTGFDPDDNLSMFELRPEMLHPGSFVRPDLPANEQNRFASFCKNLNEENNAVAKQLKSKLSKTTQNLLEKSARLEGDHRTKLLKSALINELNRFLVKPEPLYRDDALEAPVQNSTESVSVLFNRRLLEAAFPDDIRKTVSPPQTPLPVINMTLNLVHGSRLAWQERKAESFTVSPLHSGSFQIPDNDERYGTYRRTHEYGSTSGGISLGTAIAISGAAVSPNMGYYSSPVVTFLMTLFNVRLGWWLGNPGPAGCATVGKHYYELAYPKSAVLPIIAEATGLTNDDYNYIYLSDGGHFENLGLYEIVLRRCRFIVISDAIADEKFQFDNLGNAIRKIRTDFGIPIEFDPPMKIFPRTDKKPGAYCALGRVHYSRIDTVDKIDEHQKPIKGADGQIEQCPAPDGIILYIKPLFYGDEPRDIYHYAMTHDGFPHESTVDQWFGEAQFESYRKLGSYIVDKVCKYELDQRARDCQPAKLTDADLSSLIETAKQFATTESKDSAGNLFADLAERFALFTKATGEDD
jgi:hypothetical protein